MMSDFDRAHIGEILADTEGKRFDWTNAHVLRFLEIMLGKGANELPQLYKIYPEQIIAIMMFYGWSLQQIEDRTYEWRRLAA